MPSDNKFHIKHIEIYIGLFILAVGVAVAAFIIGVYGAKGNNQQEGYQLIPNNDKEEIPIYGDDFYFLYYLSGTKLENTHKVEEISGYYSDKLSYYYASLDEGNEYTNYVSIARINKNPNAEVTLNEFVYTTLQDAYNKTINSNNYSIFSEPMFDYWYRLFNKPTLEEKIEFDPLNNTNTSNTLNSLASFIQNRSHVDLKFLDNYQVKLTVSSDYLSFLNNNGLDTNILGLNVLKTSYIAKNIVNYMRSIHYDNGYIYTNDGKLFQLDQNHTHFSYNYYDCQFDNDGNMLLYNGADVKIDPYSYVEANRRFPLEESWNYYFIEHEGKHYFRSFNIDIKQGLPHQEILSTTVYGDNNSDILELSFINNELSSFTTIEEIKNFLINHSLSDIKLIIGLNNNEKNIYCTNSIKDYVSISTELNYNLIII